MILEGEAPATMEAADAALTTVTPDAPAEPTPAATEEPAAPTEGQPRDEAGRFTSTPPTAEPEAPDAEAAAPAPETPGEPTTEPAAEAPAESYPALSYRADGQEFALPGSAVGEDGAFIPKDQLPEVLHLLSAGKAAFGSVRQKLGEAAEREKAAISRAEAAEAQAQQVLGHFESLIESGQIQAWLENVGQNWPILKAEAKAKAIELQGKAAQDQLKRYQDQEQQARMEPVIQESIRSAAEDYGKRHGLDAESITELVAELRDPKMRSLVIVKAPFDDPAAGLKQGDLAIDFSVIDNAASRAARWIQRFGKPQGQQQKIAAAVAQNAKAEPVKPKIPPTVGAKGSKAPRQGAPIPQHKSKAEADKWFEDGGYNDLDVA